MDDNWGYWGTPILGNPQICHGHQWPSVAMPCVEEGTGLTDSLFHSVEEPCPRSFPLGRSLPGRCIKQCHSACRAMWTSSKTAKWLPIWRWSWQRELGMAGFPKCHGTSITQDAWLISTTLVCGYIGGWSWRFQENFACLCQHMVCNGMHSTKGRSLRPGGRGLREFNVQFPVLVLSTDSLQPLTARIWMALAGSGSSMWIWLFHLHVHMT